MRPETEGERLILARSVAGGAAGLAGMPEADRRVRGAFLAALLWGEVEDTSGARVAVHRRGLTVSGARIDGTVDISDLGAIDGPAPQVSLRDCTAWGGDDGFVLIATGASLLRLDLSHSRLSDVVAPGLRTVAETMFLRATVSGGVDLTGAVIGGSLVLSGASLMAQDGEAALVADRADIKGAIFLRPSGGHRFEARGEVRLLGATIGSQINASGASLTAHQGRYALVADRAEIKTDVFLSPADGHRSEVRGDARSRGTTRRSRMNGSSGCCARSAMARRRIISPATNATGSSPAASSRGGGGSGRASSASPSGTTAARCAVSPR
ncbi:hypothetical protein [Elioraea sp.]|uniref:hypothetical protein n=1 Tax=Elioraea sp. TaxID=2185103 RepID=UPI0026053A31|nr:hypothetical protein [Elioraea sp.]